MRAVLVMIISISWRVRRVKRKSVRENMLVTMNWPAIRKHSSQRWMDVRSGAYHEPVDGKQDRGAIERQCPKFTGGILGEIEVH